MYPILHSSAPVDLPNDVHLAGLTLNLLVLPAVPGLSFQSWAFLLRGTPVHPGIVVSQNYDGPEHPPVFPW